MKLKLKMSTLCSFVVNVLVNEKTNYVFVAGVEAETIVTHQSVPDNAALKTTINWLCCRRYWMQREVRARLQRQGPAIIIVAAVGTQKISRRTMFASPLQSSKLYFICTLYFIRTSAPHTLPDGPACQPTCALMTGRALFARARRVELALLQ